MHGNKAATKPIMLLMHKAILIIFLLVVCARAFCQDTIFIKVLFLYGSKPAKGYESVERKWFGGMLGGHAGIEVAPDSVLSFFPHGKFRWFAKKHDLHSRYLVHTEKQFFQIFRTNADSVKKAIVIIPVTAAQAQMLDSIKHAYLTQTPYDYALIGMRCGAATYEMLSQLGILKKYNYRKTYTKIFYPKKLRHRLFAVAKEKGWAIIRQDGSKKRKWERD